MGDVAAMLIMFSLAAAAGQGEALGQDAMTRFLDPRVGQAQTHSRYSVEGYPSRSVRHQPAEFGFIQHDLTFSTPVMQDKRQEWTLTARLKALDINTGAKLPGFASAFPEDLWDVRLGAGYRRVLDDGGIVGLSAEIGSASDAPFASAGETTATMTGFVRDIDDDGRKVGIDRGLFRLEFGRQACHRRHCRADQAGLRRIEMA